MNDHLFRSSLKNFEGEMVEDITFTHSINSEGQEEALRLDLYLPAETTRSPHPAILWFHGGGFMPGNDKRQIYIPRFASAFAALGYAGIAPDYRVRTDPRPDMTGTVKDAVADGRAAWAWVREHGREYRIDAGRIALAGGSAGGMLVLNLVHDPAAAVDGETDGVFAVLDLWGTPGGRGRLFERVNRRSPPTIIVHGTADALVPYEWSENFSKELGEAGVENRLITLADAPHTPLMHMDQIIAEAREFFAKFLTE